MKYETYIGFNPEKVADYFAKRGWKINTLSREEVNLVKVTKGAALECGDGRFDTLEGRESYGARVFGGVNAVMALHTGGGEIGLYRATELIKKFGATPGTHSAEHGGCGFVDLWMAGKLTSAPYKYRLDRIGRGGIKLGLWLENLMEGNGGKHFRLNGGHIEQAVRLNPFRGFTEQADDGLRFRVDDWFLAGLGITDSVRFLNIAETVEQLKPDARKIEIIVPN